MSKIYLGEFEELVLLAVCGLPENAYALTIKHRINRVARRDATLGSLYRTLNRLEDKGLLRSWMGEITPVQGGKRKRFYEATSAGISALRSAQNARDRLREGPAGEPVFQFDA